jgi:hypothetical protein
MIEFFPLIVFSVGLILYENIPVFMSIFILSAQYAIVCLGFIVGAGFFLANEQNFFVASAAFTYRHVIGQL